MGAGLTQNEEISVIARPFIIVVLAHGLLGVKASGFFFFFFFLRPVVSNAFNSLWLDSGY